MNAEELQAEWNYRFEERLGILCGPLAASGVQKEMVRQEANEAVRRLRETEGPQMTQMEHGF